MIFMSIFLFCSVGFLWAKEPILIGVPIPMTGDFVADGAGYHQGIKFAVDKINDGGGLLGQQVKIVLFDTQDFAPERLMRAADKLVGQDKVDAVHAGWAGWGQDVRAFGNYDVPFFQFDESISCVTIMRSDPVKYHNVWQLGDIERNCAIDSFQVVDQLPYKWPNKKFAIIVTDDAWGREVGLGLKETAKKRGWEIVLHQVVPYGTREWGPILTKIRLLNPALIHVEDASPPDVITFFRQFMKAPSNSIINFGYSVFPPEFMITMGKEADGIIGFAMTAMYSPVGPTPESNTWIKQFRAKMKAEPRAGACAVYTGVMVWAEAVKAVGDVKKYKAINDYIANNRFKTILGHYVKFSKDHVLTIKSWPQSHVQVQDGILTTIYTKPGEKYLNYKFQTPPWIKK